MRKRRVTDPGVAAYISRQRERGAAMNRHRILVVAVSLAGLGAVAVPLAEAGVQRSITVSGTGIVTTVPNQAEFTFGVTTTGRSAQAALSANAVRMTSVISALKR